MNLHYFIRENFGNVEDFNGHDTINEGKYFHYNNGQDRKMDNYYDTIQF